MGVNATIVVFVNGTESGKDRVVVTHFEITLEDIKASLKVNFLFENVEQGMLDIAGKGVEATNTLSRAVNSDVTEKVVFAREEHLQETKE